MTHNDRDEENDKDANERKVHQQIRRVVVTVDRLFDAETICCRYDYCGGKDPTENGADAIEFGEECKTGQDLGGGSLNLDHANKRWEGETESGGCDCKAKIE